MNKIKGQKIVSCRICKGDHWTTRCPYKDTLGPMQKELAEQLGLSTGDKEKAAGMLTQLYKNSNLLACLFTFLKSFDTRHIVICCRIILLLMTTMRYQ